MSEKVESVPDGYSAVEEPAEEASTVYAEPVLPSAAAVYAEPLLSSSPSPAAVYAEPVLSSSPSPSVPPPAAVYAEPVLSSSASPSPSAAVYAEPVLSSASTSSVYSEPCLEESPAPSGYALPSVSSSFASAAAFSSSSSSLPLAATGSSRRTHTAYAEADLGESASQQIRARGWRRQLSSTASATSSPASTSSARSSLSVSTSPSTNAGSPSLGYYAVGVDEERAGSSAFADGYDSAYDTGGSGATEAVQSEANTTNTGAVARGLLHQELNLAAVEAGEQVTVDWQEDFQNSLNLPFLTEAQKNHRAARLNDLARSFVQAGTNWVSLIVEELHLPNDQRQLPSLDVGGIAGGTKFMKQGQFFKLPEDEHNLYGDELLACKAASHELWSLQYLISCNELELSFPLMANIDLLGRRVTVSTCLPIGGDSLRYGTADAGRTMFGATDLPSESLAKAIERCAQQLHLAPHRVNGKLIHFAADIEGHIGRGDGHFYLLDTARLLPPTPPTLQASIRLIPPNPEEELRDIPLPDNVRMRSDRPRVWAEALRTLGTFHVNQSKCVQGKLFVLWARNAQEEGKEENVRASKLAKAPVHGEAVLFSFYGKGGEFLYQLVRVELLALARTAGLPPVSSDAFSGFGMDDHETHNEAGRRLYSMLVDRVIPVAARSLEEGSAQLHEADNGMSTVDLKHLLHEFGVNLRYAGKVRSCATHPLVRAQLLVEMVSRVARKHLFYGFRALSVHDEQAIKQVMADVFNRFLTSSFLWCVELKEWLRVCFPDALTADEQRWSVDLRSSLLSGWQRVLIHKLCATCGIGLRLPLNELLGGGGSSATPQKVLPEHVGRFSVVHKVCHFEPPRNAVTFEAIDAYYRGRIDTLTERMGAQYAGLSSVLCQRASLCVGAADLASGDQGADLVATARKYLASALELSRNTKWYVSVLWAAAPVFEWLGDQTQAIQIHRLAVETCKTMVAEHPNDLAVLLKYAGSTIAYVQSRMIGLSSNPPPELLDELLSFVDDPEKIYKKHKETLNECFMTLRLLQAQLLLKRGKVADALDVCERAELALVTKEYNFQMCQIRTGPGVKSEELGKPTRIEDVNMNQMLRILEVRAEAYLFSGDSKHAVEVYTRIQDLHRRYFGETSLAYANSLTNLASAHVIGDAANSAEARERAIELYRRALHLKRQSSLQNPVSIAQSAYNLATLLAKNGEFEEAFPVGMLCLEIREEHLPSPDMNTFNILFLQATIDENLQKMDLALEHLQKAELLLGQLVPPAHPLVQHVRQTLSALQQRLDPSAAAPSAGPSADELSQQGIALAQQGRLEEALPFYERSLAKQPNPLVMYNLAWALCQLPGRMDQAVQYYCGSVGLAQQFGMGLVHMVISQLKQETKDGCRALLQHPNVVHLHQQFGV